MSNNYLHILIVEDAWEDVRLIAEVLKNGGLSFTYDNAETDSDCQEFLKTNKYDVVLSDYRLPGCNGSGIYELLQQSGQDIPFILITGSLGEEAAVECIKAGMTDYVLKDRLFRLPTVVERALQEFELRRQKKAAIAQIAQQAERETIINSIVLAMRKTLVLEEVFQTTLDRLHQVLDVSRCMFLQSLNDAYEVRYISNTTLEREKLIGIYCNLCDEYQKKLEKGEHLIIDCFDENVSEEIRKEVITSIIIPLTSEVLNAEI